MKKGTILTLFTVIFFLISSSLTAQHFSTVWSGNPFQPMSFIINAATIDNVNCTAGDEIAVFDVDGNGVEICVGVVVLTAEILSGSPAFITASTNDPLTSGQDGFIDGHSIIYRIWDSSELTEIIVVNPNYNTSFDIVFTSLGTALLTALDGISAIQTTANSVTTCQGSVTVPIDVTNIIDVGEFTLILDYGTTNLSYTGYQNANAQLASGTLSVTESGGEITVTWNSSTAANIASGTLVELLFTASTVYIQTNENLTWDESNSYYKDSNGTTLQALYTNGIVTIDPIPVAAGSITGTTPVCQGTSGESYQVGAITNATSYVWGLSPSTAGTISGSGTTITIDYSATYSGAATLSVYGSNACGDGTSSSLPLNIIANPTANAGADATICEDATYTLAGSATSQQSVLWTTSGDGTFDNATILAATYTPGSNDISAGSATLTLTVYAITPCATNASDDMTLTIQLLPLANAGTDATICEDDTHTLSGAATNQQSVLWTTAGDGTFTDATLLAATYTPGANDKNNGSVILTLTASAIAPCGTAASDNMTLTIQGLPTADAGADDAVCETTPVYTLSGTASNHTSVLWTGGDGTFDNATLLNATYTAGPSDLSAGSVTLTLTAYPNAPCATNAVDDMLLTFAVLPTANAGPDDEICLNTPSYQITGASATDYTTLLWTTSGDGTFNDATLLNPVYSPGTSDLTNGTVDLTLTATSVAPCDDSDTMTLTFAVLPTADAGSDGDVCETDAYTLSGSYTNGSSCLWTTSGDGFFDDATLTNATYTPGINDIANCIVDLTITAYAQYPCTDDAVDVMILTIILLPSVDAGIDDAICENTASFATSGSTSGNVNSVLWETTGDGTFDDPTILASTYSLGPNDITNEGVDLILNAYPTAPCTLSVFDTMFLLIQPLPTSNAGDDDEVCENDSYMLSGSGTNFDYVYWTTSGDGTYDDGFLLNATYTPGTGDIVAGSVELTMHAYSISPCSGEANDVMTLTIIDMPDVNAGDDGETCEGSSYLLNGVADNYSSINWTTAGDGTFDDPALLAATYTPGTVDISNGTVDLTLTASPVSPCSSDVSDDMTLYIVYPPEQPLTPDGPIAIDLDATQTSEYTTEVTNTTSCQWYLEPVEAGTIDGTDIIGTVYWSSDYVGISAYIHVVAINDCGESTSDTLGVSVSPVGINHTNSNEPQINISPNPSLGKFSISIEGATDDIDLIIINSSGQPIHREKLINTANKYVHIIDIRPRLSGTYYLKFITNNTVLTRKVLVK